MKHNVFIKICVTILILACTLVGEAKTYLVSAGISDYPGTESDLSLPAKDAQTIAWLYSKNTDVSCTLLLDDNATKDNILAAMKSKFSKAKEDDIIVFYFSGHGYAGGFCSYDYALTYGDVRKAMASSKSQNKMIFADACFSGDIRTNKRSSGSAVQAAKKANVMLLLSSRSDETSLENRSMSNGYFTSSLQKGLRGGADANKNRIITAKELYMYVHSDVIKETRDRQHPVMWGKFDDNMPVMIWTQKKK